MNVTKGYNFEVIYDSVVDQIVAELDVFIESIHGESDGNLALLQKIPVVVHKHIAELSVRHVKGINKLLTANCDTCAITSLEDHTVKKVELLMSTRYA
jgi:hypothetical protein